MTVLLHMSDNYQKEFDATVISAGDGYVVLEKTAFYPEGGGQSSDQGELTSGEITLAVKEVRKIEGEIRHLIDGQPFGVGDIVHGVLDWERRYECMRFHTCQHVLSRYLQLNYGVETKGNNIKPGKSRADYTPLDSFGEEMKREVEAGVNAILSQNLPVEIRTMPHADAIAFLKDKEYQTRYLEMVPKSVEEFRILLIGDYDAASCAGTHVANTSEIGRIQIGKSKNVGHEVRRIYFKLLAP